MTREQNLKFTFHSLLFVAILCVGFAVTVKVMNHNDEINKCQVESGFTGLEAKAECKR